MSASVSENLVQVQVDFHEWAEYALQGSPVLQSGLLNLRPAVWVERHLSVYEVLDNALQSVTRGITNEDDRSECDRYLHPFSPTWQFWMRGSPAQIYFDNNQVHLIDSLTELVPSLPSLVLRVCPDPDIKEKQSWLDAVAQKFVRATGLGVFLHGSPYSNLVYAVIKTALFHPELRDQLVSELAREASLPPQDLINKIRDLVADEFDQILLGRFAGIVPGFFARHEIRAYNEFVGQVGAGFIQKFFLFMYPSTVWREIDKGHGPILLAEVGANLWRFDQLFNRVKKTATELSRGHTLEGLVERSLGSVDVLQEDEISTWWFGKETIALRYYLIGILSFPEAFLSQLEGKDVANYKNKIRELLGDCVEEGKQIAERLVERMSAGPVNLTEVLTKFPSEMPDALSIFLGQPEHQKYIQVQRYLQDELGSEKSAAFIFLYNELRNKLVHGVNFKCETVGTLSFEHRGVSYTANYDTAKLSFHILPVVVQTIYRAHEAHQRKGKRGSQSV